MKPLESTSRRSCDDDTFVTVTFDSDASQWPLVPVRAAFGAGPVHFCVADGPFDLVKVAETLHGQIVRSWYSTRENADGRAGRWIEITVRLDDGTFLWFERDTLRVYAPTPAAARSAAERLRKAFSDTTQTRPAMFEIVKQSSCGIDTESVRLDGVEPMTDEDLALYYGADFPGWNTEFLSKLRNRRTGLTIFDGPPGTGKTTYIRQVMLSLKDTHRFYFIGSSNLRLLREAEFVDFWASERRVNADSSLVVILEDSENALMARGSDNREEVSLLLNITDGILGEFLRLQVICTINCPPGHLDDALHRPGRLLATRRFGPLDAQRAAALAAKLGRGLPAVAPTYTLAEIFSGESDPARRKPGRIGFGVA